MNHRDGEKRVEAYARRSQHTPERRLFRAQGHFPAYRCRACKGYYTRLTGTVFAKTRQRPVTLALLLRGVAKGEPTARLARELGLSRKLLHTLRQRIQANLNATALTQAMAGTAFEADELSQNAGEKSTPHRDPAHPPRWRGNKCKGHGTCANDRPSISSVISRETGEQRFWVCDHADTRRCPELIADDTPPAALYGRVAELSGQPRRPRHRAREWAWDDDANGRREVHWHSYEGAGTVLRTYLPVLRGVRMPYLHLYVATSEAMVNAKRVTP